MDGLYFRKTTADDYSNVLTIRDNIYGGLDYIPSQYLKMLEEYTGCGGFIGHTMVGFMFATVIDDQQSALIRGSRVRKEHEGRGIYTMLTKHCLENLPGTVVRKVYVVESLDICRRLLQKNAKLVWQRNAVTFTTTKKNVKKTLESKNTLCGLKVITANDLTELFDSQKAKDILFPENRIVVNSIPYKLVKTNIAHILNSERVMYASVEELHYKHFPYVLSVVNQIKCDSGTRINFDFFGEKNDKQEVSEHFNAHVRRCLSTCDESVSIYLTYSKHVDFGTFATVFPWESIDTDIQYGIEELI